MQIFFYILQNFFLKMAEKLRSDMATVMYTIATQQQEREREREEKRITMAIEWWLGEGHWARSPRRASPSAPGIRCGTCLRAVNTGTCPAYGPSSPDRMSTRGTRRGESRRPFTLQQVGESGLKDLNATFLKNMIFLKCFKLLLLWKILSTSHGVSFIKLSVRQFFK